MNLFIIAAMPGAGEIILVLVIIVFLFGGSKIPELMKGLGKGIKEFKNATKDDTDEPKKNTEKLER